MNNFNNSFLSAPLLRLPLLLIILLVLAGCKEEKTVNLSPSPASAANVNNSVQVFAQTSSSFATHSSATTGSGEKPSAGVQGKDAAAADAGKNLGVAGEDPEFAKEMGWPVKSQALLPGSILPRKRILAYYGNPLSKRMGALGEYEKGDMLRRLKAEAKRWTDADPSMPVQPALHLIAVVA